MDAAVDVGKEAIDEAVSAEVAEMIDQQYRGFHEHGEGRAVQGVEWTED